MQIVIVDSSRVVLQIIASLIETCKLNGIEPHGFLYGTLTAIAEGHKQTDINQLLPWNYVNPV